MLEQLCSELSVFRATNSSCKWNSTLHFCRIEFSNPPDHSYDPLIDDDFIHDILLKTIHRGTSPFTSYSSELLIVEIYGKPFHIKEQEKSGRGSIAYSFDPELLRNYREFTDLVDPWTGNVDSVLFDPEHPDNERQLFSRLINTFGSRIAHFTYPQIQLSEILTSGPADAFMAQRADFVLNFPNGSGLILEPGDHDDPNQISLDRRRDAEFTKIGIQTLRPRNTEIGHSDTYRQIREHLKEISATHFLQEPQNRNDEKNLSCNYLFLLPAMITRLERLLLHFMFKQGLIHRKELRIGVIERDLECAEISLMSFVDRVQRLAGLYGIACEIPMIELFVQRNSSYRYGDLSHLDMSANICDSFENVPLDLVLDVGIKCNSLTPVDARGDCHFGSVRQSFKHNRPVRFGYRTHARSIKIGEDTEKLMNSFIQDFFRKHELRPGQGPILRNVLSQKSTIGLLPTSAGKSLCYQLASLLTPGTTIIVDPIVALMKDQVQSLGEQYGIDRVLAWHAGAGLHDQDITAILGGNVMMFVSPERLLRPTFRTAMKALNAADIYINYAVIDEAHCVSMWGHDFRPSYLTLERNFREYCTFQNKPPVLVALTGTASQLVLIDLKRELNIQDLEAIVRPDTFDRPELRFSLVRCTNDQKNGMLSQIMTGIAGRLNVHDLHQEAHGIIFAYTPNELWGLFGAYVANATNHVQTVLQSGDGELRYGIYTGGAPKDSGIGRKDWDNYKDKTLSAFKRGKIRLLFGNTAVSVGIDNEYLNYIINYKMPQSMEAYYQQCGRAGRAGQRSECYLMFSDDKPKDTQKWLNREVAAMPKRWDDLGTVAYFHQNNFPGKLADIRGALVVFGKLFGNTDDMGMAEVPMYLTPQMALRDAERTERYLSYWLILGVLSDYEVTGMERNTIYHVRRDDAVERFLKEKNQTALSAHIVDHLHAYLSRYRPTARMDVEKELDRRPEGTLREKSIGYLVSFIYDQIEYQRREAIRTMVSFCNETDISPDKLRMRIKSYFDSSKKFSAGLLEMTHDIPGFESVATLLNRIEGFDDVEHLYWETRRLLDERFRADWASANVFAIAYRTKSAPSEGINRVFNDISESLLNEVGQDKCLQFLTSFLSYLTILDKVFGENLISASLIASCLGELYRKRPLVAFSLINSMNVTDDYRQFMTLFIANQQLKEITHAQYSRTIR